MTFCVGVKGEPMVGKIDLKELNGVKGNAGAPGAPGRDGMKGEPGVLGKIIFNIYYGKGGVLEVLWEEQVSDLVM